jgi:hypothetical protein
MLYWFVVLFVSKLNSTPKDCVCVDPIAFTVGSTVPIKLVELELVPTNACPMIQSQESLSNIL